MQERLSFDVASAVGKFNISQFTFKGEVQDPERRAYPDMILYANMEESNKFRLSLHHYSAIKPDDDSDDNDGFIGCFDKLLKLEDLPAINIDLGQLLQVDSRVSVKGLLESIVETTLYQYSKLVVSRYRDGQLGPTTVRLKCFKYWYDLDLTKRLKFRARDSNLAGGIITSSFIVDGSAKRTLTDLGSIS